MIPDARSSWEVQAPRKDQAAQSPFPQSRRRIVALVVGAGGLLGAFLVAHVALILQTRGHSLNLATVVANILNGLAWAALAPLAVAAARRLPLFGDRWGRHLLAHAALALAANAAVGAVVLLVTRPIDPGSPPPGFLFVANFLSATPLYLLLWVVVVALAHAYDYAGRFRERERRAAELEGELARAQLDVLRAQLNPHFLFNTLNAVSTLMARDVKGARAVLHDLSALLRLALDRMGDPEVPLADELDFLGHYLDVERARFHDRLSVTFEVEPGLGDALVPPLVLQPLVENALKHAVAPRASGGRVEVRACREEDDLVLVVVDDGPGLPQGGPARGGIGLQNTGRRLETLYGRAASFTLADAEGGGLAAAVRLPFHTRPIVTARSLSTASV